MKPGVFLVDDSAVARMMVKRVVDEAGVFEVVGHAASADQAIQRVSGVRPDLVLLDIEMPGMSGIDAIPHIMHESGNVPILVLSSHCSENAEASVRAMAMGASDTLLKPTGGQSGARFGCMLRETMLRLLEDAGGPSDDVYQIGATVEHPVRCLAIGASTGGVHALNAFLAALPAEHDMPILIAQHLPADFMPFFARQIEASSGRKTVIAEDGEPLRAGKIYIAPGNFHLAIAGKGSDTRIALQPRGESGPCPSVDPLFASVGACFGTDAVGVMLTGMGRDGAQGAATLVEHGGSVVAQDRGSAVIWGMPGAVVEAGIAHSIAPPAMLAAQIAMRARAFGWN